MAINLIEQLTREFTGDVIGRITSALGEPDQKVQAAVGGVAPALVAALASKATTSQGLSELLDLARTSGFDGSQPGGLAGLLGGGGSLTDMVTGGAPLLASLFGSRQTAATDWLSSFAGIGSKSASSLLALAAPVVLNLLGSSARKAGGFTPSAIGEILAGQGTFLRDKAPAGLASALGLSDFSRLGAPPRPAAPVPMKQSGANWWPWLLIPLLALAGWWWFAGREPVGTVDPKMAIVNDEGKVVCSASVRDESTKDAIVRAVRASFGATANCDVTVDRNIRKAAWLPNLDRLVAALKRPGADFQLDGNAIRLGGWLSAGDRKAATDDLRGLFGTGYTFGEANDKAAEYVADMKSKAIAALTAMGTTFSAESFAASMNLAVINFATGSAAVPADAQDLLARAAVVLKAAPAGTMIEVGGHTDNVGDAASNLTLSEARASAVRQALVAAGVNGAMLVAKGYGDTKPVASNESEYGRFRNRRIEYAATPPATK